VNSRYRFIVMHSPAWKTGVVIADRVGEALAKRPGAGPRL
jgi:hypothetical protein